MAEYRRAQFGDTQQSTTEREIDEGIVVPLEREIDGDHDDDAWRNGHALSACPSTCNEVLLHQACRDDSATPSRIRAILMDCHNVEDLTNYVNYNGQTALHIACSEGGARSDVVSVLLKCSPATVTIADSQHIRPLDIVCQKIIMKEERARYSQQEQDTDDLWKTCYLLVQALARTKTKNVDCGCEQPMVHLCVQLGSDCPVALWKRALVRFRIDLETRDEKCGNLPLHVAASLPVSSQDDDDENVDHVEELLSLYPGGAMVQNLDQKLPLDLATENNRFWDKRILTLLQANPGALVRQELDPKLFPMILSKLGKMEERQSLFLMVIASMPDLFANAR